MYELSLIELESELSAELPTRTLMRRRRRHGGAHASAAFGSVANGNSTDQVIFNPQIAIITGVNGGLVGANGALVNQIGANSNGNTNTQFGVPVNFFG